jgi:hypothetical protein
LFTLSFVHTHFITELDGGDPPGIVALLLYAPSCLLRRSDWERQASGVPLDSGTVAGDAFARACREEGLFMLVSRCRLVVLFLTLSLLLSSCASKKDVPFTQPVVMDVSAATPSAVTTVGVITEACILRDDPATDYWVVEDSRSAASYMLASVEAAISRQGYRVGFRASPFVGSYLPAGEPAEVVTCMGDDRTIKTPPFYVSPEAAKDEAYEKALRNLISLVAEQDVQGGRPLRPPATELGDSTSVGVPNWALLRDRVGTDYLLVAASTGTSVSGVKQTGQSCVSSCLSVAVSAVVDALCSAVSGAISDAICSGGTSVEVGASSSDTEPSVEIDVVTPGTLRSAAIMFDLTTGEKVWTSTMTYVDIDPTGESFYEREWGWSVIQSVALPPKQ